MHGLFAEDDNGKFISNYDAGGDLMRVQVINDRCVGHGMCKLVCPELFELSDEDGHAFVLNEQVPSELEESVDHASRSCPEKAILIT